MKSEIRKLSNTNIIEQNGKIINKDMINNNSTSGNKK